ncbi:hypothetical protein QUC32_25295 [Novosphingobium resinovorum]|jgi:hypothetical protein|uniref:Uncharacterized protein n=1 Tax=Novosphingobium resinovorum TaxID=158500 RepID=A0A031JZ76_9SPHN|nr:MULTISPECIES: hypothetical protein [Novosphingobium]AOR77521.1 hypothetical protein BES08_12710 [Novosphingobium resinovorum]EZP82265.1 hypothetical protein BV97_02289 [Novosphingobium resinovorum]MBF7012943.1 hypothetical protein [Novosphingobium sp. HR1a]WJM27678.1 hypothetical protein QUC32_25295 [Novosphingobium resinovorum]
MSYANRPTNWGCLTAFVLMTPIAFILFIASIMGGGGCEGRKPPCVGDYTPMWIMMGAVIAVAIGLALCVNLLIAKVRSWRDRPNGS